MMFSSRVVSLLFLLITLGTFVAATPIESTGLVDREVFDFASLIERDAVDIAGLVDRDTSLNGFEHLEVARSDLEARSGTCNTPGCNEKAILTILLALRVKLLVWIKLLDGHRPPAEPCRNIIAIINAAVKVLLTIDVNISIAGALCVQIVAVIVDIIVKLVLALNKYPLNVILALCIKIDIALCALLKILIALIPGLVALIVKLLRTLLDINILIKLKFVLCLRILGL